ncbi:MAG: hypothetical protein QNJ19_07470 [Woeseiaceae bacterium]|nr:hypothetical protein [Woeseiaceae bacterium]
MRRIVCLLVLCIAGPALGKTDPLFESNDTLKVTIEAPFKRILQTRSLEDEEQGTFTYTDEAGQEHQFAIQIRARGKSRREPATCNFPPIRLNFKKSETKDTLFDKQDKLKLVTHCKSDSVVHKQGLLREYLVYRMFNLLTDRSFRVRLLEITYEYSEVKRRPITEFGFLIEHKNRLGKRIDAKPVELIGPAQLGKLHSDFVNLATMFHYLIANVDFSTFAAAEEDDCCHNHILFGEGEELYYSIPYDFDMSGFVSAEYAVPNPRYGLRRITQRYYRGHCVNNEHLPQTLKQFDEKRDEFYALVETFPHLSKYSRKLTTRLMDDFYKIIDDPRLVEKRLEGRCH